MNVNIENAKDLAGVPFRLASISLQDGVPNFREEFQTGFEYWTRYKADIMAKKTSHRVGYWEDGKFKSKPKFSSTGWEDTQWSDYEYEDNGKKFNYFKKKFLGKVEFKEPVDFPDVWNQEERQKGVTGVSEAYITITAAMYAKIEKYFDDARSNSDQYITIVHTPSNPPATKYEVTYHSEGETREEVSSETETEATVPSINLFPQEAEIVKEVAGDEADAPTLVEYIMGEAEQREVDMSVERATEIAEAVIVGGVVTLP